MTWSNEKKDVTEDNLKKVTGGGLDGSGVMSSVSGVFCPKCGSGDIDMIDFETDCGPYTYQCRKCQHTWVSKD